MPQKNSSKNTQYYHDDNKSCKTLCLSNQSIYYISNNLNINWIWIYSRQLIINIKPHWLQFEKMKNGKMEKRFSHHISQMVIQYFSFFHWENNDRELYSFPANTTSILYASEFQIKPKMKNEFWFMAKIFDLLNYFSITYIYKNVQKSRF